MAFLISSLLISCGIENISNTHYQQIHAELTQLQKKKNTLNSQIKALQRDINEMKLSFGKEEMGKVQIQGSRLLIQLLRAEFIDDSGIYLPRYVLSIKNREWSSKPCNFDYKWSDNFEADLKDGQEKLEFDIYDYSGDHVDHFEIAISQHLGSLVDQGTHKIRVKSKQKPFSYVVRFKWVHNKKYFEYQSLLQRITDKKKELKSLQNQIDVKGAYANEGIEVTEEIGVYLVSPGTNDVLSPSCESQRIEMEVKTHRSMMKSRKKQIKAIEGQKQNNSKSKRQNKTSKKQSNCDQKSKDNPFKPKRNGKSNQSPSNPKYHIPLKHCTLNLMETTQDSQTQQNTPRVADESVSFSMPQTNITTPNLSSVPTVENLRKFDLKNQRRDMGDSLSGSIIREHIGKRGRNSITHSGLVIMRGGPKGCGIIPNTRLSDIVIHNKRLSCKSRVSDCSDTSRATARLMRAMGSTTTGFMSSQMAFDYSQAFQQANEYDSVLSQVSIDSQDIKKAGYTINY